MRGVKRISLLALALLVLAGCYQSTIRGTVVDLEGNALPGVAISVEGTRFQDLSNALGQYAVRYNPGPVKLRFDKTGYTPALVDVKADAVWRVTAPEVTLWRLPANRGVFFFENGRYTPTDPVEPAQYSGAMFGTEKWPSALTTNPQPRLIAYHLPLKGVSLVQMKFIEAVPEGAVSPDPVDVWAPGTNVTMEAVPIDRPEHLLVELRYQGTLAPGTYAVQWGALDGNREPVPSIYLFSVESEGGTAEQQPPAKVDEAALEEKILEGGEAPKAQEAPAKRAKPDKAAPEKTPDPGPSKKDEEKTGKKAD